MKELASLRDELDQLDKELILLLARRFQVTREVGLLKRRYDLPSRDPSREADQYLLIRRRAEEAGLDPLLAEQILKLVIELVVQHHEELKLKE